MTRRDFIKARKWHRAIRTYKVAFYYSPFLCECPLEAIKQPCESYQIQQGLALRLSTKCTLKLVWSEWNSSSFNYNTDMFYWQFVISMVNMVTEVMLGNWKISRTLIVICGCSCSIFVAQSANSSPRSSWGLTPIVLPIQNLPGHIVTFKRNRHAFRRRLAYRRLPPLLRSPCSWGFFPIEWSRSRGSPCRGWGLPHRGYTWPLLGSWWLPTWRPSWGWRLTAGGSPAWRWRSPRSRRWPTGWRGTSRTSLGWGLPLCTSSWRQR